jgi:hypothetical protein
MGKYIQLNIPKSCSESWNNMTPVQQGRHCQSCEKTVVDFTGMTDAELVTFFIKNTGNTCGRFTNDQLQRDLLIPKKKVNWMKYFFQIALPAFIFSSKLAAQKDTSKTAIEIIDTVKNEVLTDSTITNQLPTDSSFSNEQLDTTILKTKDSSLTIYKFIPENINIKNPIDYIVLGNVITTVGFVTIDKKSLPEDSLFSFLKPSFLKKQQPIATPPNLPIIPPSTIAITLFPNPIKSGTFLNIKWQNAEVGEYEFSIVNDSESIVQTGSFYLSENVTDSTIALNVLPSGNYKLVIVHPKSNKQITQQFIIF